MRPRGARMIPVRGLTGARVAVLGLGRSGLSAARALAAGGAVPVCWDDNAEARARAEAEGFVCANLKAQGAFDVIARLIVSPGIPHLYPAPNPVVAAALEAGVPVDNDIGLFFQSLASEAWAQFATAPRVIAVTGSNGKSTTCALIDHIMDSAGRHSQLAGNIGRGVLDIDPPENGGIVVLELSSYQTDLARSLTPDVAVFTNLTPDHLDRHAGMGGYFAAKRRRFAEGGPDRAVIGVDEAEGRALAGQLAEAPGDDRVMRVSVVRKHQNACAAFAAARAVGVAPKVIEAAFASFAGLPHRSQRIAEAGGVTFVNDSKATNVDSAAKALAAFDNIRWICGGLQKEGGLAAVNDAASHVRKAYVIGREAAQFALQLDVDSIVCGTMDAAVAAAMKDAEPGDVVLLAPAAASFDQYDSFEARGADFVAAVNARI